MENVSKAIIIASATLLAILIIGIVVFVVQTQKTNTESALEHMSQIDKKLHNKKLEKYAGQNVKGEYVMKLINVLMQINATASEKESYELVPRAALVLKKSKIEVAAKKKDTENSYSKMLKNIVLHNTYSVRVDISQNTGIVEYVEIREK